MILAGDIGGTNARLAYFQSQNGKFQLVSERIFPSREHRGLGEIVTQFLDESGTRPEAACFGIAGPVRNGRVETSNLPWVIEQSALANQIHLAATLLINDLEAIAWGIGALGFEDLVTLNPGGGTLAGNQAVVAPGTGLGEAGLFWDGNRHLVFACEGGHTDFAPRGELQVELLRFLTKEFGLQPPYARRGIDYYTKNKIYPNNGDVTLSGLKVNIEVQAQDGIIKGPLPPPEKYIDTSYLREAQRELGIQ